MSTERATRLRNAEKLLRQERLEEAIAEYRALVEAQPGDWNTANTLGDLYLRTKAVDKAVAQFVRIADGYLADGFLPKAAALYRKVLKASPGHEETLLKLADIAIAQGLVGDARTALETVRAKRRARGDEIGLAELDLRQAALNPDDFAARHRGALAGITLGNVAAGVQELKSLAAELMGRDRRSEAIDMMRQALAFAPADVELRLAAVEGHLRDAQTDEALRHAGDVLSEAPERWLQVVRLAAAAHPTSPAVARRLSQLVIDQAVARKDWDVAMVVLQDALSRTPRQLPWLEPLAEAARATGATEVLIDTLDHIADLRLGTPEAEAPLAELVILQPDEPRHEARLRQVRIMIGRAPVQASVPAAAPAPVIRPIPLAEPEAPLETLPAPARHEIEFPQLELVRPDEPLADEVDLSVALDEIQPQAPLALPTRDGVRAPEADTEQEFIRATALLASGQVNDAIVALEAASRAPRRRFETASLLGRVFRERGDMSQAIEWFERAAEAPSPDAEASHAVLYELADTLEQAGETTRALAIYLEVQADRGVYRDVESRVERLMRSESGE